MTWDYSAGGPAPYEKKGGWFPKWPDPFANQVKDIQILACEGEWLAAITMANDGFGAWFTSSFIPQPTEIVRKYILGSYRCGFFLTGKRKSPLDIIWRNGAASKFLARLAIGPTSLGFVFWGAQTLWEGLSTFHTLMYASEKCDRGQNEVIAADALNTLTGDDFIGDVGLYNVIWNPKDYFSPLGGGLTVHPGLTSRVTVYGDVLDNRGDLDEITITIYDSVSQVHKSHVTIRGTGSPSIQPYELPPASFVGPAQVSVRFSGTQVYDPLPHNYIYVNRFIAHIDPVDEPCKAWVTAMPSMSGEYIGRGWPPIPS